MSDNAIGIETCSTKRTSIPEAISLRNIFFKRLEAGADKIEDDDLPHVEDETEETPTKKVRLDVPFSEETVQSNVIIKKDFKHIAKVIIFSLIWCLYTIPIIIQEETKPSPILMVIKAKETTNYELDIKSGTRNAIDVIIMGAFLMEQDVNIMPDEKQAQLMIQIVIIKKNGIEKEISGKKALVIQRPDALEYVVSVSKEMKFHLSEDLSTIRERSLVYLKMQTNIDRDMTVKICCNTTPVDQTLGLIFGTLVLIFLYISIIWEVINRTLASVVASMLAIGILAALNDRPSTAQILNWLDVETLTLLFGMMILVSILSESGIFDYLAVLAYEVARGELFVLIYILCFFTGFLSAFLDNVTMMLLMTPVTIRLCEVTNLNPVPVLMSMVIYSNVGAALTPVGDPPNVIIMTNKYVQNNGVNFGNFILHMLPGVLLAFLSIFLFLFIKYPQIKGYMNKDSLEVEALKHEIQVWEKAAQNIQPTTTDEEIVQSTLYKKAQVLRQNLLALEAKGVSVEVDYNKTLQSMKASYPIRNKALLIKSCLAFSFVMVLFFLHTMPHLQHLSLGWSALVAAILLIIMADVDIEAILSRVEWSTLLFFACLFILMEALSELGVIGALGELCIKIILLADKSNRLLVAILIILWVTGIASAFLDNIPVATMMIKIVVNLSQDKELDLPLPPLVWALAFGACFGGNGTLIGASANVVSSGVAEQHGYRFSFVEFFVFGFPIMLTTLATTTIYLYLAHCFWAWH